MAFDLRRGERLSRAVETFHSKRQPEEWVANLVCDAIQRRNRHAHQPLHIERGEAGKHVLSCCALWVEVTGCNIGVPSLASFRDSTTLGVPLNIPREDPPSSAAADPPALADGSRRERIPALPPRSDDGGRNSGIPESETGIMTRLTLALGPTDGATWVHTIAMLGLTETWLRRHPQYVGLRASWHEQCVGSKAVEIILSGRGWANRMRAHQTDWLTQARRAVDAAPTSSSMLAWCVVRQFFLDLELGKIDNQAETLRQMAVAKFVFYHRVVFATKFFLTMSFLVPAAGVALRIVTGTTPIWSIVLNSGAAVLGAAWSACFAYRCHPGDEDYLYGSPNRRDER